MLLKLEQIITRVPWPIYTLIAFFFLYQIGRDPSNYVQLFFSVVGCSCMTFLAFRNFSK